MTISGNLNVFNTLTLKQISGKRNSLSKNWSTISWLKALKIENASFPYETAISEANVKTNRMVSTNGPITKNGVLPVTTLSIEICFSLRTSCKELI